MTSIRPAALQIANVSKSFEQGSISIKAVDRCSLSVVAGEVLALTGRSGSGKTTLANMILGWVEPDSGSVTVVNPDRCIDIAVVPQDLGLYQELNAGENAVVARFFADVGDHWDTTMETLGISDLQARQPDELSLGEQQRIAVARALVTDAAVIVADEPTSHQDEENSDAIIRSLSAAALRGAAVLLTTHDPRVVAFCDRTVTMSDGRLGDSDGEVATQTNQISDGHRQMFGAAELTMVLAALAVVATLILTVMLGGTERTAGPVDSATPPPTPLADDYGSTIETTVESAALGQPRRVTIFLPPGYDDAANGYPVLYMLHGQQDGPQMFRRLGMFRRAAELINREEIEPMVIVAPDIGNSFGVNNLDSEVVELAGGRTIEYDGGRYEDFLADDLPSFIEERYNTSSSREGRYVGGISMGGFAALHLGLRHTDRYSKVGAHSPALVDETFGWLYPSPQIAIARNPLNLAAVADLTSTAVFLDASEDDEFDFDDPLRDLTAQLQDAQSFSFEVWSGTHDDTYWRRHVDTYLRFYGI